MVLQFLCLAVHYCKQSIVLRVRDTVTLGYCFTCVCMCVWEEGGKYAKMKEKGEWHYVIYSWSWEGLGMRLEWHQLEPGRSGNEARVASTGAGKVWNETRVASIRAGKVWE